MKLHIYFSVVEDAKYAVINVTIDRWIIEALTHELLEATTSARSKHYQLRSI